MSLGGWSTSSSGRRRRAGRGSARPPRIITCIDAGSADRSYPGLPAPDRGLRSLERRSHGGRRLTGRRIRRPSQPSCAPGCLARASRAPRWVVRDRRGAPASIHLMIGLGPHRPGRGRPGLRSVPLTDVRLDRARPRPIVDPGPRLGAVAPIVAVGSQPMFAGTEHRSGTGRLRRGLAVEDPRSARLAFSPTELRRGRGAPGALRR